MRVLYEGKLRKAKLDESLHGSCVRLIVEGVGPAFITWEEFQRERRANLLERTNEGLPCSVQVRRCIDRGAV